MTILKNYLINGLNIKMTKKQLQKEWNKMIDETHKRSKLGEHLKDKNILLLGDLLLYAQILLDKIEVRKNAAFNEIIYKKTINFYCSQMKKYV
ncbi:MAG: hypothetical protein UR50_C0004G0033 [Parcubacteria group bacterium GW2011_GWC1_34_10]|nr:MAG: hypothetical protein UR50_C0004G0033 [Parcubacteria group bacterium GW2011_GWC1_34_10]